MRYLAVALLAGCSSSSSSSTSANAITAVAESKELASLTTTEAKQYCDDLLAYNKTNLPPPDAAKLRCAVTALAAARDAADDAAAKTTCKKAYDDCIAAPLPASPTECDDKSIQQFASCKGVTIADSNACLREAHAHQSSFLAKDVCAAITPAGAKQELSARNVQGPACQKLTAACNAK